MNNPISTYRIQFHKEFTLDDFEQVLPYLQKLGVSTIYASPIFESTPGSTHGYDGMNPHQINPEIGSEEQLMEISRQLKVLGISWLQDIVPNHMAFHPNNPWLMDVLEKGRLSEYASFFDIDWNNSAYNGKVLVPFLGAPLEDVLGTELELRYKNSRFVFSYYETSYPLNPRSYVAILSAKPNNLQDIRQLLTQLENLHMVEEPKIYAQQWRELLLQLSALMKNAEVKTFIDDCLAIINSDKEKLRLIAAEQAYHLDYWKVTDEKINFRRFFTVNGLICLNIQDEQVFQHFHSYIKSLAERDVFQGLRIDHIDGISDPGKYLKQLREAVGEDQYIIVEKILEQGEELPKEWPVQGNTGYDFLSMVNNLFTDKQAEKNFTRFYKKLTGDKRSIHQQLHDKKAHILHQHMGGELNNLYQLFLDLNLIETTGIDINGVMKAAIAEFLIQCPVYRYYGSRFPLQGAEADAIQDILNRIRSSKAELYEAVSLLEQALLIKPQKGDAEYNQRVLRFYQRCMQFTGPLMAKGVEDTLMYTYNRFIGHNEVGDSPEAFGYDQDEFHRLMIERQAQWPLSLNGTSTHDTKRGEDVRARLNVLTEMADGWIDTAEQWRFLNRDLLRQYKLDANDEYFIYQTLIGSLPMPGQDDADYESRIHEYLVKALREAKINSDWASPDEEYEARAKRFASALLDKDKPFFRLLKKLNRKIADFGIINSLSQLILKFTCPGIPDIYQGCELWDLSLVDPDNRRPVNYKERLRLLESLETIDDNLLARLWEDRYSGGIKLWLTHTLLSLRRASAELFAHADYIPLKVKGKYKKHVFAFARRYRHDWVIVAVPLHLAKLGKSQKRSIQELKWKKTRIVLPENVPGEFRSLLKNNASGKTERELFIRDIFTIVPFALLTMQKAVSNRGAGILMHITSLTSPFGIGDFGPGARQFADYLSASGQKYWQLLPLGPTEEGQGYSPYSAISSMGGNTLLISPELLADEGLLPQSILQEYHIKGGSEVDYSAAKQIKERLFDEAYHNFCNSAAESLQLAFSRFCEQEAYWLDDFALYLALKNQFDRKPWYEWPDEFKLREKNTLEQFAMSHIDELNKIKFLQFVFFKQWIELKNYCNKLGIQLFGDLPFYVSNDSSDVWANKEIFCLDAEGKMTGVAGVPPDFFNDNGQLWGMPVFKWDVLKEQNYDWWVKRIKKNMQLYDLLRLDHFRAFSSYWDVPAGEETAKNGEWKPGPASGFFQVLQQELGDLPFVAEDLGDVDQAVYDLRDEFNLPGMRVVQFSFGDDLAKSVHTPHNFNENSLVYTGTHDNNTTRGWYRQDADKVTKQNIEEYSGQEVAEKNIHLTLGKLAYSSVAKIVILPMQDVVGLDEEARMNTPASVEKNWGWRLKPNQLKEKYSRRLREWVKMYNRE